MDEMLHPEQRGVKGDGAPDGGGNGGGESRLCIMHRARETACVYVCACVHVDDDDVMCVYILFQIKG